MGAEGSRYGEGRGAPCEACGKGEVAFVCTLWRERASVTCNLLGQRGIEIFSNDYDLIVANT